MPFNPTKYDFSGKVALITGSSSGIGAEIALHWAQYGAKVTIHGRDAGNLQKVADRIVEATGGAIQPLQILGDLNEDEGLPARLIDETIAAFGQLDFLVNNAGGMTPNGTLTSPNLLEEFDSVMKLNVRSIIALTQLAVPHLEKTKGNIINVASIAALKPIALVYSTSKVAVDMITKCTALELGPKGIRVNSVNPGYVITALGRSMGVDQEFLTKVYRGIQQKMLLSRVGQVEDIANLASFLASDDAVNITGSMYLSDSGFILKPYDFNSENLDALQ